MSMCVTINDWQFKTWHRQTEIDCKLRCWCYYFIKNNIDKVTPNFGTVWVSFEQMACIFLNLMWRAVLRCILLYYVVLFCYFLCYAMLCFALLVFLFCILMFCFFSVLCCAVLCYVVLFCVVICFTVLCFAVLCCAVLWCAVLYYDMLCCVACVVL